ncbi:hypothetical protein KHA80_01000 [Anaerobacillus sp. HL2]|nr:hypothetical protein KHA80_01000 [Anaerobacillus sp. HL2]
MKYIFETDKRKDFRDETMDNADRCTEFIFRRMGWGFYQIFREDLYLDASLASEIFEEEKEAGLTN